MESLTIRRLLFSRFKAWHLYASVLSLLCLTCFLLIASPNTTSLDARDDEYRDDWGGGGRGGGEGVGWRLSKYNADDTPLSPSSRRNHGRGAADISVMSVAQAAAEARVKKTRNQDNNNNNNNNNKNNKNGNIKFSSWVQFHNDSSDLDDDDNNNTTTNNNSSNNNNNNNNNRPRPHARGPYDTFLEKPVINRHDFRYLINQPDKCQGQSEGHVHDPVTLVITTPSAPANFFRRMKSRRAQKPTSGNDRELAYSGVPGVRHLFFLGATNDSGIQAKVEAESRAYGDIVQEDYLDVYKNITFKAVQMLKWVSQFCPQSRYVIRLDDDVRADVSTLLGAMEKTRKRYGEFVMGTVKRGWPPCRIPKCRTTKEEYPYATLPPFALGGALGYPTTSVIRLYEATKRVKLFKLDDVYVTGMCAPLVHVVLLEDVAFSFEHHAW